MTDSSSRKWKNYSASKLKFMTRNMDDERKHSYFMAVMQNPDSTPSTRVAALTVNGCPWCHEKVPWEKKNDTTHRCEKCKAPIYPFVYSVVVG